MQELGNAAAATATDRTLANPLAPAWLQLPTDGNTLDANVWPTSATRDGDGMLTLGGVRAATLLEQYGSPLYVIDADDVGARAAAALTTFDAAFSRIGAEVHLHYATKALLTTEVVRWMLAAGLQLDVASAGELEIALAAGAPASAIHLHGNNKPDALLRRAITLQLGSIIIDSLEEAHRAAVIAAECGHRQRVLVRVNSGIHASTHEYLATSGEDQKFGLTFTDAREAVARIRAAEFLEFIGLHSHIGSSIYDTAGFGAAAQRLMELRATLLTDGPVPELNLGGGLGIAYLPSDDAPTLAQLANGIADEVARACESTGTDVPTFVFEPGRILVGPAGVTLYTLGTTKRVTVDGNTRRYLSVDGGMGDNARPALYGANYTVRLANRLSNAPVELVRVVGSHCEAGDIVVAADYLPADVRAGDLLAVPATGAYCFSLSNSYNFLERPAMVAVAEGSAELLVRRLTISDYLAADAGVATEKETS